MESEEDEHPLPRGKSIGRGSYGEVYESTYKGQIVAVKKFRFRYMSMAECKNQREVMALKKLQHPNIVKYKETIFHEKKLYLVFELMHMDLEGLLRYRKKFKKSFDENEIRVIIY
jgi:serine/threonine protein kinase